MKYEETLRDREFKTNLQYKSQETEHFKLSGSTLHIPKM